MLNEKYKSQKKTDTYLQKKQHFNQKSRRSETIMKRRKKENEEFHTFYIHKFSIFNIYYFFETSV